MKKVRLKDLVKIHGGQDQKNIVDDNGLYDIYGSGGPIGKTNSYLFTKPSVLLGRKGTIDKPLFVSVPFWSVDTMFYTSLKKENNTLMKYVYYLTKTIDFNLYQNGSAVPSMTSSILNNISFVIKEEIKEQINIVNFLDKKISLIDKKISFLEKKIELYEECKKKILNDTISKGIKDFSTKDSKIHWIGEINKNFRLMKLKNLIQNLHSGGTPESGNDIYYSFNEEDMNWCSIGDMKSKYVSSTEKRVTKQALLDKGLKIVPKNTILYSIYASLGKVAINVNETTINQAILAIYPNKRIIQKYLYFYLLFLEPKLLLFAKSTTQNNLNSEIVKNFIVILPETQDQVDISNFLEEKFGKIDKLIELTKKEIELQKEYKKTLINDVVTGKIEV